MADDAVDPEHYEALVPGYGWCRVRRVDIQSQRVVNQSHVAGQLPKHGIKSLELTWCEQRSHRTDDDYVGLCRFLHLVGAPLEVLTLSNVQNVTLLLGAMWTACPLLTNLELQKVGYDVLRPFSDAYESGTCRVRSLVLRRIDGQRGQQDVVDFCAKLCDPQRQISRTLTKLSLCYDERLARTTTDAALAAMERMLECNKKLVFFSVNGCGSSHKPVDARFSPYNNQPLPGQGIPLELTSKLAFLSAVCPRGAAGVSEATIRGPRAMTALACDVIAVIFEMSAGPVKRTVFVTSCY